LIGQSLFSIVLLFQGTDSHHQRWGEETSGGYERALLSLAGGGLSHFTLVDYANSLMTALMK